MIVSLSSCAARTRCAISALVDRGGCAIGPNLQRPGLIGEGVGAEDGES
jgi:hypothetical protein